MAFGGNIEQQFLVTSSSSFSARSGTLLQKVCTYRTEMHQNLSEKSCSNVCDQIVVKYEPSEVARASKTHT